MNNNIVCDINSMYSKIIQSGLNCPEDNNLVNLLDKLICLPDEEKINSCLNLIKKVLHSVNLNCLKNGYNSAVSSGNELLAAACHNRILNYSRIIEDYEQTVSSPKNANIVDQSRKDIPIKRFPFFESLLKKRTSNLRANAVEDIRCDDKSMNRTRAKPWLHTTTLLKANDNFSDIDISRRPYKKSTSNVPGHPSQIKPACRGLAVNQQISFRPIKDGSQISNDFDGDSNRSSHERNSNNLRGKDFTSKTFKGDNDESPSPIKLKIRNDKSNLKKSMKGKLRMDCTEGCSNNSLKIMLPTTSSQQLFEKIKKPSCYQLNDKKPSCYQLNDDKKPVDRSRIRRLKRESLLIDSTPKIVRNNSSCKKNSFVKETKTKPLDSANNVCRKRKNRSCDSSSLNLTSRPSKKIRRTSTPLVKEKVKILKSSKGSVSLRNKTSDCTRTSADTSALTNLTTPTSTMSSRRGKMRIFYKRNLFGTPKSKLVKKHQQ